MMQYVRRGAMNDVTQILCAIEGGDRKAAAELLPLVYNELRKLAAQRMIGERPGQTLQATALVHEAYMRLVGSQTPQQWNGRAHFFGAAAEAMRRILVDNSRRRNRIKRGGGLGREPLDNTQVEAAALPDLTDDLVELDAALDRLAQEDPQSAELVKLRYFAGLTIPDAADVLGVSPRKADLLWAFARAWLRRQMAAD
jgi:RNA polymerase sigma factor (TIGR02999 family)